MASIDKAFVPAICRIRSTDGDEIDLLDPNGFNIIFPGWIPGVAQLKGGGVRVESQSQDTNYLVAGGYENVTEEMSVQLDANDAGERLVDLQRLLWKAEGYSLTDWLRQSAYLEVQTNKDAAPRYSRLVTGAYRFGNHVFGDVEGMPDNALSLEREPYWHGNVPGEMTGPFQNWIPNPSFEFWSEDGIGGLSVSVVPIAWLPSFAGLDIQIDREGQKVAGPSYALKESFTSGVPGGWHSLRTMTPWPGSHDEHTLRFWLIARPGVHTFTVRLLNDALAVVATVSFAADYTGWYYLPVNAPWVDGVHYVELYWTILNQASGGSAIVDRMTLTRGAWTADNWPSNSFYYSCTNLFGWEDDETYFSRKVGVLYDTNRHHVNFLDVEGVPGDVEAPMLMSVDRLGEKYGFDLNWPILKYWMFQRRIEARDRSLDEKHISLNVDPIGYTGNDNTHTGGLDTSSESVINVALAAGDDWRRIFHIRADGIEETKLYQGRFRVVGRAMWNATGGYESQNLELRLVYWIGSQINSITLDTVSVGDGDYFRLVNLTPRALMDWLPLKEDSAALAFAIEVRMEGSSGTGEAWLDEFTLGATDGGLVSVEWEDEEQAWWQSQALILDGSERSPLPVTIGSPGIDEWVRDMDFFRAFGAVVTVTRVTDSQTFLGSLYVLVLSSPGIPNPAVLRFDHRGWAFAVNFPGSTYATAMEAWNGLLWIQESGGIRIYHPDDGILGTVAITDGNDLYGFGGWLFVARPGGTITRLDDQGNVATDTPGADDFYTLESYKRKLYIGTDQGNVWTWDHLAGYTNLGAVDATATDIYTMKTWRGKLWIAKQSALGTSSVYSWDGDSFTTEFTVLSVSENHLLQVYDDVLYWGLLDTATNDINIYATEDGVNWVQYVFPVSAITSVGAMQPFDGRLFVGIGPPRGIFDTAVNTDWLLWHTRTQAKLYAVDYSGGAFTLPPSQAARFYQKLEALNVNETRPDAYLLRPTAIADTTGPQTHVTFSFDPRWRTLRDE